MEELRKETHGNMEELKDIFAPMSQKDGIGSLKDGVVSLRDTFASLREAVSEYLSAQDPPDDF